MRVQLPGCFRTWTFPLNIGLSTLPVDSFMQCLAYLLRGVPGFATDCTCRLWCSGLTTCLLYVGPLFGNLVWNDNGFVSFTKWRITFSLLLSSFTYILMPHNVAMIYFRLPFSMSQIVLYFLHCTLVLSFYTDVVLTRSIHNLSYWTWITGDRLNMNIPYRLTSIGIPIVKIRLSHDRLIFTLGILYLVRRSLYWDGVQQSTIHHIHYCNVARVLSRRQTPGTRLFVQQLVQADNKGTLMGKAGRCDEVIMYICGRYPPCYQMVLLMVVRKCPGSTLRRPITVACGIRASDGQA